MKQVYYGWYVVAIAAMVYALLAGSTVAAFGVFVLPVSAELKLSRAEMNTALALITLGNAALAPFLGRIVDRVPAKRVLITGAFAYALSLATLGLSHSIWLSAGVLALGVPIAYLSGSLTNTVLVARWFTALRGRAMLLTGLGLMLGAMVGPPVIGALVETWGWRTALLITGAVVGALLLALTLLLRERPGPGDVEVAGASAGAPQVTEAPMMATSSIKVSVLLRSPLFWLITLSTAASLAISNTVVATLVPLARENGASTLQATSLISVMGGVAIAGGLVLAAFADKLDRVVLLSALFMLGALLNALLMSERGYPALVAGAAVLGLGTGTITPTFYALLADRFGATSFGTVRGLSMLVMSGLAMVTLRFGGEVFDRTGGYDFMFAIFIALQLAAAALMFATRFKRHSTARLEPKPG